MHAGLCIRWGETTNGSQAIMIVHGKSTPQVSSKAAELIDAPDPMSQYQTCICHGAKTSLSSRSSWTEVKFADSADSERCQDVDKGVHLSEQSLQH
jgi:hypothetical protein